MDLKLATATQSLPIGQAKFAETDDGGTAIAQELKKELEAAKAQLKAAAESDVSQFISIEDQENIQAKLAIIEADLAIVETWIKTGKYDPNAQLQVPVDQLAMEKMKSMAPGWNGFLEGLITPTKTGENKYEVNLTSSGMYETLNPGASNALAYVLSDKPGAKLEKVVGKTIGKDTEITAYYSDGSSETTRLDKFAVRPEKFYIYAGNLSHGVIIDMSKVVRIADGNYGQTFGAHNGIVVWGSKYDDTIIGSEFDDILIGSGGSDKVYGMLGKDILIGDEYTVDASGNYIMGQFSETDGNDYLDGGEGADTIRAGGGSQDVVVKEKRPDESAAEAEKVTEAVYTKQSDSQINEWLAADKWTPETKADGTIELSLKENIENGEGGKIDIKLPTGYTMASATADPESDALIVTMVGFDSNGKPQTIRLKIDDFFNPDVNVTVNIHGNGSANIIDASTLLLQKNVVNIYGEGASDTLLAPQWFLDSLGLDLKNFPKGTKSNKELKNLVDELRNDKTKEMDWGGYKWKNNASSDNADFAKNGEIVLEPDAGSEIGNLAFDLPAGFTDAVLLPDPKNPNDLLLVLINRQGENVEQVVVRIVGGVEKVTGSVTMDGVPVPRISMTPPEVYGGSGSDTVIGSQSSAKMDGETIISGAYEADVPFMFTPKSKEKDEEEEKPEDKPKEEKPKNDKKK